MMAPETAARRRATGSAIDASPASRWTCTDETPRRVAASSIRSSCTSAIVWRSSSAAEARTIGVPSRPPAAR